MSFYLDIVRKELKKHNVRVVRWSTSCCGESYYAVTGKKTVKIPRPIDTETCGVCFHEIGHSIKQHQYLQPSYFEEYEAEQYAIKKLKQYGIYSRKYEHDAILYVIEHIAKYYNEGNNLSEIPKKIVRWTGIKINKWKKSRKVTIDRAQTVKSKKDIKIQYL